MSGGGARVVLDARARDLRRRLSPLHWAVLEEVALAAEGDGDGALRAPTSARAVAAGLGITPGAAARALARLVAVGLVDRHRLGGPAGRFGPSVYGLGPLPGLEVLAPPAPPGAPSPRMASPRAVPPCAVPAHVATQAPVGEGTAGEHRASTPAVGPRDGRAGSVEPGSGDDGPAGLGADRRRRARPGRRRDDVATAFQLSLLDALQSTASPNDHATSTTADPRPRTARSRPAPDPQRPTDTCHPSGEAGPAPRPGVGGGG